MDSIDLRHDTCLFYARLSSSDYPGDEHASFTRTCTSTAYRNYKLLPIMIDGVFVWFGMAGQGFGCLAAAPGGLIGETVVFLQR